MSKKPELIVFSQYLLGGGASFHRNLLGQMPENSFNLKVIYLYPKTEAFTPSIEFIRRQTDVVFEYGDERLYDVIKRLSAHISNSEGAIVANLGLELYCLDIFPKNNKTIYFICHDSGFLELAKKFDHVIDVVIAHNREIFDTLKKQLPHRDDDIFFIPHGVELQCHSRASNSAAPLRIAFLARHHLMKGIYDLLEINKLLTASGVEVEWLIMGDGPERQNFIAQTKDLQNFHFAKPATNREVLGELKRCDLFILPSRKDGLPVALLEAMSVGCVPLISAFSEGIREVVTNEIGYVVDVGNSEGFAEYIIALHWNRDELIVKSSNSIESIARNYNVKDRAKQYFDLYADYAKYKKTTRGSQVARLLRKAYYFGASKLLNTRIVHLKRKLFNAL